MVQVFSTKAELAMAAATLAAERLRDLLAKQSQVRLLAATGASQLEFLDCLAAEQGIDWPRVELFHLDEYVGLSIDHPASFAGYIKQRIVDRMGILRYHLLDGASDPKQVVAEAGQAISSASIDLAFNDPPADFEIEEPYLIVELDEACRRQQVGEGWFASLDNVPRQAISISIHQLLKAREILCVVPDERKAQAVHACLMGSISPEAPASILRIHPNTTIFLDKGSAALLSTP
jgi:glucosamine-6-phosphate deaminase